MIDQSEINGIAARAAAKYLSAGVLDGVSSRDTFDSEGRPAIRITIRLKPKTSQRIDGDAVLDTLVHIKSGLAKAGEERPSIVEYEELGEAIEPDDANAQS